MEDKIMDKINKNLKNIDSLLMENGFYKYIGKIVNIENGISQLYDNLKQLQKELEQLKEIEKEHQKINGCLHLEIKELKEKYTNKLQQENQKYKEVIDKAINELMNIPINASYSEIEEYPRKAYRILKEVE